MNEGAKGHVLVPNVLAAQINDFRWSPDGKTLTAAREF
jgi:hypothetical protein